MKKYNLLVSIFIIYIIINMVIYPQLYIEQTLNGITAWALNVLPSILPFIVLTKILSSLGCINKFTIFFKKIFYSLFKTPAISSYVFFTSIISGYPVGAKMTADLYLNGEITKQDAFRMTSFCSTSGPMFILGAVGIGLFHNIIYGYILLISHILGAFFNGIIYRNLKVKDDTLKINDEKFIKIKNNFSTIIIDSTLSILSVGVIITLFFVIITSLNPILNLFPPFISSILSGFIEITKGCIELSNFSNTIFSIIATSFIISFGGLSTIIQSITMLDKLKMPLKLFILQKFTQAVISTIICFLIFIII